MLVPIIILLMMGSLASLVTYSQEAPEREASAKASKDEMADRSSSAEGPDSGQTSDSTQAPSDASSSAETPADKSSDAAADAHESSEKQTEEHASEETPAVENSSADTAAKTTPEEVPVIEAAPAEEKMEIPETEAAVTAEPTGIDTVSLENPQGNWLFKRIWWERAQERYEKIRIMVDEIWQSRNTFFHERNELDRKILDPFYMNIGIDRGELQLILSEINDFLEKHRDQEELTEQERVLASEEETLKQLKRDVDMITNLDQAIDDALGTFMDQINRVRNYEGDAWKNFKEIAYILNDNRARELYYMIEGAARNIKTISSYLEQDFLTHFNKLVSEAKTRVNRIQGQMESLKEKGVLFQKQAEQLEQQSEQQEIEEEKEISKPKVQQGWFDSIFSSISHGMMYVWSIIRLPYDMIFGK
jgi:hypothetical protein